MQKVEEIALNKNTLTSIDSFKLGNVEYEWFEVISFNYDNHEKFCELKLSDDTIEYINIETYTQAHKRVKSSKWNWFSDLKFPSVKDSKSSEYVLYNTNRNITFIASIHDKILYDPKTGRASIDIGHGKLRASVGTKRVKNDGTHITKTQDTDIYYIHQVNCWRYYYEYEMVE